MQATSDATAGQKILYRWRRGFTFVELLVCVGIIALLVAILLPALNEARRSARLVTCAGNLRQICQGLVLYSLENRGNLPINVLTPKPKYWYDAERLGRILTPSQSKFFQGGLATCPDDIGALRSYSMNVWASSLTDSFTMTNGYGSLWRLNASRTDRLILAAEKWSAAGSATDGWTTATTLATTKDTPGRRFGGGGGIPVFSSGHFGQANCELPYRRHRSPRNQVRGNQPVGRVNIGYADGHVALKSNTDLVDSSTGLSTMDSWWSPLDFDMNK